MTLLTDLEAAEGNSRVGGPPPICPACQFLEEVDDPATKQALERALAGTIGIKTLVPIIQAYGATFARRTIERHRREGHTA